MDFLLAHCQTVFGVWRNAIALGVEHDPRASCRTLDDQASMRYDDLWTTLDLAWEVLIGAINIKKKE